MDQQNLTTQNRRPSPNRPPPNRPPPNRWPDRPPYYPPYRPPYYPPPYYPPYNPVPVPVQIPVVFSSNPRSSSAGTMITIYGSGFGFNNVSVVFSAPDRGINLVLDSVPVLTNTQIIVDFQRALLKYSATMSQLIGVTFYIIVRTQSGLTSNISPGATYTINNLLM